MGHFRLENTAIDRVSRAEGIYLDGWHVDTSAVSSAPPPQLASEDHRTGAAL